jgi:hypothetical protein
MKKQTAVEWLEYQLKIYGTISDENTSPSLDTLFKMLEQAKAMEKEQIVESHLVGQEVMALYATTGKSSQTSIQYYNETFGS